MSGSQSVRDSQLNYPSKPNIACQWLPRLGSDVTLINDFLFKNEGPGDNIARGQAGNELLYARVDSDRFPWGGILRFVFKIEILPVY